MKDYVDRICAETVRDGATVDVYKIAVRYRDGALVAPLSFEPDEFCGIWFVWFGVALERKFKVHRLDLGQARFRFPGANDVHYPGAIRENQAKVKRDELIEALDLRFGADNVNTGAKDNEAAYQICQNLWPCVPEG